MRMRCPNLFGVEIRMEKPFNFWASKDQRGLNKQSVWTKIKALHLEEF